MFMNFAYRESKLKSDTYSLTLSLITFAYYISCVLHYKLRRSQGPEHVRDGGPFSACYILSSKIFSFHVCALVMYSTEVKRILNCYYHLLLSVINRLGGGLSLHGPGVTSTAL